MPRVHQQDRAAVARAVEILARQLREDARRVRAAPGVAVAGEVNQVKRPGAPGAHPVIVRKSRLARRSARPRHRLAHQGVNQARLANI